MARGTKKERETELFADRIGSSVFTCRPAFSMRRYGDLLWRLDGVMKRAEIRDAEDYSINHL